MENICKNCVNCTGGDHKSELGESFEVKDKDGLTSTWFPMNGSKCKLTDCYMFSVVECEKFEESGKFEEKKGKKE